MAECEAESLDSMIDVVYKCKVCSTESESSEQLRQHVKEMHIEKNITTFGNQSTERVDTDYSGTHVQDHQIDIIVEKPPVPTDEDDGDLTQSTIYITKSGRKTKRCNKLNMFGDDSSRNLAFKNQIPKRKKIAPSKPCSICRKSFQDPNEQKLHEECHLDHQTLKCTMCDYTSLQWGQVKIHMHEHNNPNANKCTECGLSFASQRTLKNHWRFHHLGGEHLCEECGYQALSKYALFQHGMKFHHEVFTCEICGYTCDNQIDMDHHTKLRHMCGYLCKLCSETKGTFATRNDLQVHMSEKHPGKKCFVCDKCNYVAKLRHHLEKHYLMHTGERPLKCSVEECGFSSRDLRNFKKHMARNHGKAGDLVCGLCHFVTRNQNDYDVHKAMNHMKIYKCEHCAFEANSSACIRRHRLSKHVEKDKMRYPCSQCSYVTNFRESLNKHLLTHVLKNNRHRCVVCKENFSNHFELKGHLFSLHPVVASKVFFCDLCPYSCMKTQALQYHVSTHSDDKPHKCKFCDYRSKTTIALRAHTSRKHHNATA